MPRKQKSSNPSVSTMSHDDMLTHVSGAFQNLCSRHDGRMYVPGQGVREVSIYRMSDNLVRVDFKREVK